MFAIIDILQEGRRVFDTEIEALIKTRDVLDDTFAEIVKLITGCKGKIIVSGMGKPGHIAAKTAASLSSLGTPSFCLDPAEAMHGDLGMISADDVVLLISYSGESDEIVRIIPNIKLIGASLIALTGNANSTLARAADTVQVLPRFAEACPVGPAPTSSTTAELVYGDAVAVTASAIYGFKDEDYLKLHPAGSLGKKLILTVDDLMAKAEDNAVISDDALLKDAIVELSKKGLGVVTMTDKNGNMTGIITDGDLRRQLEKGADVYSLHVKDIMTVNPVTVKTGKLAAEALRIMKEKNISCMPVVDSGKSMGTIRVQDIIGIGIVG